jgi:Putative Flp pilus-assembly TadE/G-like
MRYPKLRKGQMAVVMTLVIVTLLGVMSLGTDVAVMYYNWMQLQKAADASALAGATYFLTQNSTQTLPTPTINGACAYPTQQQNVACTYALNNFAQMADMTQGGIYIPAQSIPAGVPAGAQTIQVTLKRTNIPVFFMQVLGRSGLYGASASSTAVAPTPVSSIHNGLFPAGMPATPNMGALTYGTTFSMTDSYGPGNWGWLNIPTGWTGSMGPQNSGGATLLNTNIANGCTCDVKVGDVIATKTGEDWGQTLSGVNSLITAGSLPASITGKESQLVTVPIVDWGSVNGASQVTVLGFAEVWIDSISKHSSTQTLTVQFVRFITATASGGGGTTSYGAYLPPYIAR